MCYTLLMNWLVFIIAWLIAPALVIAVAYIFAALLGFTFVLMLFLCAFSLFGYLVYKIIWWIRLTQNPIHKTNRKYLKGRLSYLP